VEREIGRFINSLARIYNKARKFVSGGRSNNSA
jgi:hypothetical protein